MPSPKAAIPAAARPPRRDRARSAVIDAHARRITEPTQMLRWLGSYIVAIAAGPATDREIADTVRGIADGLVEARITAETPSGGTR